MASHTQGIGLFTAENIAGNAQEHGAILSPYTNPVG